MARPHGSTLARTIAGGALAGVLAAGVMPPVAMLAAAGPTDRSPVALDTSRSDRTPPVWRLPPDGGTGPETHGRVRGLEVRLRLGPLVVEFPWLERLSMFGGRRIRIDLAVASFHARLLWRGCASRAGNRRGCDT